MGTIAFVAVCFVCMTLVLSSIETVKNYLRLYDFPSLLVLLYLYNNRHNDPNLLINIVSIISPVAFGWLTYRIWNIIRHMYTYANVFFSNKKYKRVYPKEPVQFDVVLSFSGDDRNFVGKLAQCLIKNGLSVFYDEREQPHLLGKNLYDYLISVYSNKGRFCVVCISKSYAKKLWTLHELRSAQARALKENYEYLLPIKLDDTHIPSILDTVAYVDARTVNIYDICAIITQKVAIHKVRRNEEERNSHHSGAASKRHRLVVVGIVLVLYAIFQYLG